MDHVKKALIIGNSRILTFLDYIDFTMYDIIFLLEDDRQKCFIPENFYNKVFVFSCFFRDEIENKFLLKDGNNKLLFGAFFYQGDDIEFCHYMKHDQIHNLDILPSSSVHTGMGAINICATHSYFDIDIINLDFNESELNNLKNTTKENYLKKAMQNIKICFPAIFINVIDREQSQNLEWINLINSFFNERVNKRQIQRFRLKNNLNYNIINNEQ